ncbi:hypothetical protein DSO57_1008283 [Entomophthora muscae]|uniref:Uncharacterized protein n=1 Tax=Entomophthora muscae TaxID=34485 RepID=A0ACC2UHC8_9FUNG|nr:hypothetical protein DSO57_1008283 [Entomophthora muscae]
MEGTQQQSDNAPVVHCSCGCPRMSKNKVSATQVPTQIGDGRGEFNSDIALTQPSINPWVPKLTQKNTKVITTKTVSNKDIKLTLFVFDTVYRQELVPSAMMKKVKPVIDTSYKLYTSDGNQEDKNKSEFYRTTEGQLVLKKVAAFYTKVPMPCKPVSNQDLDSLTPVKPAQKHIPDIGNCGKVDSLKLDSLILNTLSSTRESSAAYGFKTKNQG